MEEEKKTVLYRTHTIFSTLVSYLSFYGVLTKKYKREKTLGPENRRKREREMREKRRKREGEKTRESCMEAKNLRTKTEEENQDENELRRRRR